MMDLAGHGFSDRLTLLLIALIANLLLAGPPALLHMLGLHLPGRFINGAITGAERKLNREKRTVGTRVYRGLLLVSIFVFIALLTASLLSGLVRDVSYGIYLEMVLLVLLLPMRQLMDEVVPVARALRKRDLDTARKLAAPIARRNTATIDQHAIIRSCIEHLAENFADKILAPTFWYLLFGLPGLFLSRLSNQMDSLLGQPTQRYVAFGWAPARLDDLLQLIPARLSVIIFTLSALFVPKGHPWRGLRTALSDASKLTSPNSGWPIATAAGALGLSLAGPRSIDGTMLEEKWLGSGRAKALLKDLRRGIVLYLTACMLLILLIATGLLTLLQFG